MTDIDTSNDYLVGSRGRQLVVMRHPAEIDADAALRLAAWLVAMAEPFAEHTFAEVQAAVENT